MSDAEIIAEVANETDREVDDDDDDDDEPIASLDATRIASHDEAVKAVNGLFAYFEAKPAVSTEFLDKLRDLLYEVDTMRGACVPVQSTLTQFFDRIV